MQKINFKLIISLAFIAIGAYLIFFNPSQSSTKLASNFASEPVSIKGFEATSGNPIDIAKKIIVPAVGIDLEVKISNLIDGYWEVHSDSAGWGIGSGTPGSLGNQVIFAHARAGLFLPLKSIKNDDRIYILADKGWYSYKVVEIKDVYPNQTEVIEPTPDETLTLYTCSGFNDQKRLIVVAKRDL